MRSKLLLISNLYATFFLTAMIHWLVSAFWYNWDFFGNAFYKIYTVWLEFPVSMNVPVFWHDWYGDIMAFSNYIGVMAFSSIATAIAYIFGWFAFSYRSSALAGFTAFIYIVIAFLTPAAIVYTIPLVILSVAGFFGQKALI